MTSFAASSRSSYITESNLQEFLSPTFSPIDYLNATLPSHLSSMSTSTKTAPPSLSILASQTQSHISVLTAQLTRLSTTLTALMDEILRASPRLAYEVELLRGEALSLSETLSTSSNLHSAISQFVPQNIDLPKPQQSEDSSNSGVIKSPSRDSESFPPPSGIQPVKSSDPPINDLRTLLHVRALLTKVTQTFSLALSWPFPPSLLSTTASSIISVSSPADPTLEAKGQVACTRLRQEIVDLLETLVDGNDGLERAAARVMELRECVGIWKGTGEEKARSKFVDGLEEIVEERTRRDARQKSDKELGGSLAGEARSEGKGATGRVGPGLFRNLQRLREEIYMD
ncbi:hypothetical protein MMC07_004884 [Pseudocyphellaria aurata]|nr:hypothetical protein [Pseudocyphellaria aurata]